MNCILWNPNGLSPTKWNWLFDRVSGPLRPAIFFFTESHAATPFPLPRNYSLINNPADHAGVAIIHRSDVSIEDISMASNGRIISLKANGIRFTLAYWPSSGSRPREAFNDQHFRILKDCDILLGDFNSVTDQCDASYAGAFRPSLILPEILEGKSDATQHLKMSPLLFTNKYHGAIKSRIDRIYGDPLTNLSFINNLDFPPDAASAHCPVAFSVGKFPSPPDVSFRLSPLYWESARAQEELAEALPEPSADECKDANFPKYLQRVTDTLVSLQSKKRRWLRRKVCKAIALLKKIPKSNKQHRELAAFLSHYSNLVRRKKELLAGKRWSLADGCPSIMLTRMLKSDSNKANVDKIRNAQNEVVDSPPEIAEAFRDFYQKLYEHKPHSSNLHKKFLDDWDFPDIDRARCKALDKDFKLSELKWALKSMRSFKAPGSNGLPALPFKILNEDGLNLMLDYFNALLRTGQVPAEWKEGIIITIFKKGDKLDIGNRRPITLLKTEYKILSKMVTNRLNSVVKSFIHVDQVGFIQKRQIFDNVLVANEVLSLPEKYAISVDFCKAYDSISHAALFDTLRYLRLPTRFINLIQGMIAGSTARIRLDTLSNPLPINRGVKQGDPLSPLLFAIAIEPLANWFRKNCTGAKLGDYYQKVLLYADDIMIFAKDIHEQRAQVAALNRFAEASGLYMNADKSLHVSSHNEDIGIPRAPPDGFRYLGFQMNDNGLIDNSKDIFDRLVRAVKAWRFVTWNTLQKAAILTAYIMSKLWFFSFILDFTPYIDRLVKLRKHFLWNNSFMGVRSHRTKMRQERTELPRKQGGLGLMHLPSRFTAQSVWIISFATHGDSKIGPIWNALYGLTKDSVTLTGNPTPLLSRLFEGRLILNKILERPIPDEFIPLDPDAPITNPEPKHDDKDRLKSWMELIRGKTQAIHTVR